MALNDDDNNQSGLLRYDMEVDSNLRRDALSHLCLHCQEKKWRLKFEGSEAMRRNVASWATILGNDTQVSRLKEAAIFIQWSQFTTYIIRAECYHCLNT